ncbi:class I SAM-dependent methyltransferase [Eubacteriales bacterium OttesenSCG-928-A19]|nr:class I SAM-dependent methyltransferase [Eubacteriales bacterium OttesenSCG-928-A19]
MDHDLIISRWNADIYERQETQTDDVQYLLEGFLAKSSYSTISSNSCPLDTLGSTPPRILELACGGGRILAPLAEAGYIIDGVDLDDAMLDKCRARIADMPGATCRRANALTDDLGTGYDVVLLAANLLLNITADMPSAQAQRLLIARAAACLAPGGRLFVDFDCTAGFATGDNPAERVIFSGTDSHGVTGTYSLYDAHNDGPTRTSTFTRRFALTTPDGERITREQESTTHFPSLGEVMAWLAEAGVVVESMFSGYSGNPITQTTRRATIWATKP